MRKFFLYFVLFGLWSSWLNSKYKCLIQIYSIVPTITIFSCVAFFSQLYEYTSLGRIISNTSFILILMVHSIVSIETLLSSNIQVELIKKFSLVDRLFHTKLRVSIPYLNEKQTLLTQYCILVPIMVFSKIVIVIYFRIRKRSINFTVSSMYSTLFLRLRLIQVLFFVYLVRNRLNLIKRELIKISRSDQCLILSLTKSNVLTVENAPAKPSTFDRLIYIKRIYGELFEISELINRNFGWSLLTIVTISFLRSTVHGYLVFSHLHDNAHNIARGLVSLIIILIPNMVVLVTLALYCSSCSHCVRINRFIFENGKILTFYFDRLRLLREASTELLWMKIVSHKMNSSVNFQCKWVMNGF